LVVRGANSGELAVCLAGITDVLIQPAGYERLAADDPPG
jgi:hypothetical protein